MNKREEVRSVVHPEAYSKYYSTHFKKYQTLDPSASVSHYRAKLGHVLPKNLDARILEIGAGLGKFAYFLKLQGYSQVTYIDVSDELVRLAKEYAGVDVLLVREPMEFLRAQGHGIYDAVFMLDVIEHIRKESVVEYLGLVRTVLKPSGWLHLTTENMASPIGGRIQHYLDFTHEYNYSEVSLRQVLEIAGFHKIEIWATRDPIGRSPRSVLYWLMRRIWYGILRIIYAIERPGLVKPTIYGKELIASAQAVA